MTGRSSSEAVGSGSFSFLSEAFVLEDLENNFVNQFDIVCSLLLQATWHVRLRQLV